MDRETVPGSSWKAWWIVGFLVAIYTCSYIDRSIISLLIQPMRRDLGISDTEISLLQGVAFALFYVMAGFPLGWAADRYSRRILIFIGTSLWSVATALCGMVNGFGSLFLARMGVGIGEATLTPAASSLIADLFSKEKLGRAFSIYNLGISIGQGLGLLIGGTIIILVSQAEMISLPLLGEIRPWQATFIVVGLPGIFLALLMFTFREPARRGKLYEEAAAGKDVTVADVARFIWTYRRAYLFWIFGSALLNLASFGYNAWMPTALVRTFGLSAGKVGQIYGVLILILSTSGTILAGFIVDRLVERKVPFSYYKVLTGICLGFTPFAVLAPLTDNQAMAWVFLAGALLFSNAWPGLTGAALLMVTPNEMRGQSVAIRFFVGSMMGFAVAPTLIALLTDHVFQSDQSVRYSLALVSAIAIPLAWLCFRVAKQPYERMAGERP